MKGVIFFGSLLDAVTAGRTSETQASKNENRSYTGLRWSYCELVWVPPLNNVGMRIILVTWGTRFAKGGTDPETRCQLTVRSLLRA